MAVKIAQASSSEAYGRWGEPGNSRRTPGKLDGELNVMLLSDAGSFTKCFRWKDADLAKRAADLAYRIVANEKVGYSQNNGASPRTSLLYELRACHWVPEDIKNKCNTDCSAFCTVLCRYNDLDTVSEDMWTGNQCEQLRKTGAFTEYTITPGFKYKVGDILWREGHTATVCEAEPFDEPLGIALIHGCYAANIRKGDSINTTAIGTVHVNDIVPYYEESANGWYKVEKDRVTGYVHGKYVIPLQKGIMTGNSWLRSSADPNTDKNKFFVIDKGETVYLTGKTEQAASLWYEVYYNGQIGMTSGKYCKPL